MADLADYLELTVGQAREQVRALRQRRPVSAGRQVTFLPVETLLCLAASFVVNHRHFGGSTAHQAPEPVLSLARLFSRRPSSVLAKMANVAFDTGLITVNGGLRIHLTRALADAVRTDPMARQYYGRPPLREVLTLPPGAQAPATKYLDWHRQKVFVA